ncbi:MAG: diguanylate cyclase [Eubacterium sp.]|nr:diguanylate cyclase [Eubacterium sp.]
MIDRAIKSFVQHRVGGVIVSDEKDEIIYSDPRIILSDHALRTFKKRKPSMDDEKTWELSDTDSSKYYRVETATVTEEGARLQCHLFTDVSDYASLFKDISDYSKQISDISDFQKTILGKLSHGYDACLPDLCELCQATEGTLYMEIDDGEHIRISSFHKRLQSRVTENSDEYKKLIASSRFDLFDGRYCFLSEQTGEQHYALFLRRGMNFNEEYFREASVYNVIRLFIENGVLREKIIYESEHDKLTDLYNKDKYIISRDEEFGRPEKIAVFNFDVNNLKLVNDTRGHEAGDRLIVKAAESLKSIIKDDVIGYRIGGDEFVVIGIGLSSRQADELKKFWEKALDEINKDEEEDITLACGVACGEGEYDLDDLLGEADKRMYENKKEMKKRLGLYDR